MRRRRLLPLVLLFALTACGSDSETSDSADAAEPSETATASTSPFSPTPTPTPEPDADEDGVPDYLDEYPKNEMVSELTTITVICDVKGRQDVAFEIDRVKPNFKQAWKTPLPDGKGMFNGVYCESDASYEGITLTPVTDIEQAIWDADKKPNEYTISIPYEQCVEHGTRWMTNEWPVGNGQIKEAETALMLCPRHPDAAAIRSRIADIHVLAAEHKQGTAFGDGNFRVGPRIKSGTYFTENVENCYWERLDSAGEIIDNNFVSSGLRVEVSIASSDFSFHSQGCGTWRRVG